MNSITLKDCSISNFLNAGASQENILEIYSELLKIGNKSINELLQENEDLLIFPGDINNCSDKLEDSIVNIQPAKLDITEQDALNLKISTSKLMGFVGVDNCQLNITSRFDSSENNYFLHYMLQRICHANIFDMEHFSGDSDSLDILIYFFPLFLKRAMRKGVYRAYKTFHHNDSSLKGVLKVSRHIKENIPFYGNIAYDSREISFDNNVTELVRHTIEYINCKPGFKSILEGDKDIKKAVSIINQVTPSYDKSQRKIILEKNRKTINHPYYKDYANLQSLCKLILRHKKLQYSNHGKSVYGILFDGAWLWEEYLASLLETEGFIHPQNKERTGGIRLFDKQLDDSFDKNSRKIYPDFYKPNEYILDAKYKPLIKGVGREDLYQVISYMHTMRIDYGGYIYPDNSKDESVLNNYKLNSAGYGGYISVIGLSIPQNQVKYKDFVNEMKKREEKLLKIITDYNFE